MAPRVCREPCLASGQNGLASHTSSVLPDQFERRYNVAMAT